MSARTLAALSLSVAATMRLATMRAKRAGLMANATKCAACARRSVELARVLRVRA